MPRVIERTVYKFDELSPAAKVYARGMRRDIHVSDNGWWSTVYEDAERVAECLGVSFSKYNRTPGPAIHFHGFCGQGDGASFIGTYEPISNASQRITEYAPKDEELQKIAKDLDILQVEVRLMYGAVIGAAISTQGNYSHSGAMTLAPWYSASVHLGVELKHENELLRLMRAFADWIYAQLQAEHDYLTSDECIDESFDGEEFDESGALI